MAVVGASERPGSVGAVVWQNLTDHPGGAVPVSRTATELHGRRAYASLQDCAESIDLAVLCVPADAVAEVVADAAAAGVGACIVLSGGFAEVGPEGRRLQAEVLAVARGADLLLVGPNCLGVQNWHTGLNASLAPALGRPGGISVLTHSGSYAMALGPYAEDNGCGFSLAVSTGNGADLADHEVLAAFTDDPATEVVCAFLERVGDGRALLDQLRATVPIKPVVITLVGGSTAGGRATVSHTGSLAADRRAWVDLLSDAGAVVAASGAEMLDIASVLSQVGRCGTRVAVVTNSGGVGVELSDLLEREGLSVPPLSDPLRAELTGLVPGHGSTVNPVDVTTDWPRFPELYAGAVASLARSGEVDVVVPVLLQRSAENTEVAGAVVGAVQTLRADAVDVPVVTCWVARRAAWSCGQALREAGVPCIDGPAAVARAIGGAARAKEAVRRASGTSSSRAASGAVDVRAGAVGVGPALELIRGLGIPVVESRAASTIEAAVEAAEALGFPVVLKVDHEDLVHKTDVGGVRVGLADAGAVRSAANALLAVRPGARVVVQPQTYGLEVFVGGLQDPTFGSVVCFGLGGIHVGLLDDVRFASAPLGVDAALRLIGSVRGSVLFDGLRGSDALERQSVAEIICRIGDLMADNPAVLEVDLNPIIVSSRGCTVVDARVVLA